MRGRWIGALLAVLGLAAAAVLGSAAGRPAEHGDEAGPIRAAGAGATWTTVFKSVAGIEGLTGDGHGDLYVADRAKPACRVWRIARADGSATVVGTIANPCSPSGLAFDASGKLYVTGGGAAADQIDVLAPDAAAPPVATVFASGVPGANGVAFDRDGNLWTGDGTTGQGRVWKIAPDGTVTEILRIPPTANPRGVGRQVGTLQPGNPTPNPQPLVANGVAFTREGDLLVADTARGAIWKVQLDHDGNVSSPRGCDETLPADTLCFDDVWAQNPYLEGADGFVLDRAGNVWTAANERNAIVVATANGRTLEFFRNPVDPATGLRNEGPLELPTSPFVDGRTLCVTQSDGNRRDNSPSSAGEVGGATGFAGKISCLDERLPVPGLPLPVGG